jgi:hypothetical protein
MGHGRTGPLADPGAAHLRLKSQKREAASLPMRLLVAAGLAALLAGCQAEAPPPAEAVPDGSGRVVLAGVVVDAALRPLAGALVDVTDAGANVTTGADGSFLVPVPAGAHVLEVSHPGFATLRQEVQVPETGLRGLTLRLGLPASAAPYATLAKYDGFVACSLGVSVVFSEECGEGVGTPLGRFGKQPNNAIRHDFQADSPSLKTLVVEQAWEPTSEAGREMLVLLNTGWACEPACAGDAVGAGSMQGPSPLLMRADEADLAPHLEDPAEVFTAYTLARNDPAQANVLLNQPFQLFVSMFYREAAPEGHSFVAGT